MSEARERTVAEGRSVTGIIDIEASPEAVWAALTDAAELERWFPLEARVQPGPDGSIWMSWQNEFAGESRILAWDPPRRLVTSWGWPEQEGGAEPGAEQAQVTEYVIEARGGGARVRVVTSGFPEDSSWDEWVEGTRLGWRFELRSLKHYLERHAGERRSVVYLRRRVATSREAAWPRLLAVSEAAVRGAVFDDEPGRQRAWVTTDPPDGLGRLNIEGSPGLPDRHDIVVWISAWGDAKAEVRGLESRWRALLERAFPEGETV